MVSDISFFVARPVEIMVGLFVIATSFTKGKSVNSKEEILQLIGGEWRQMQRDLKEAQADREERGPQAGDRRARSQRKGSNRQSSKESSTKKSFKKRGFKN
mgnify:CR=1 FL=1